MKLYRYSTEPEAQKIKFLLEAQNIPCEVHSFENWGYDGALRGTMGMGEIIVPDDFGDRAKEILRKFKEEEKNKSLEEDPELRKIKLTQNITQYTVLIRVIYLVFIALSYLLLFRLGGLLGILLVVLLAIGVVFASSHVKKELVRTKQELKNNPPQSKRSEAES